MISGKYFGLHMKIQDVTPHAYCVHSASHNLNLVLKDDMEAVTATRQFYDTIEPVLRLATSTHIPNYIISLINSALIN